MVYRFLHFIFNDIHIFESCVAILLLLNALFKRSVKRLVQRGRYKANSVADLSRHVTKPISIYSGMFL